MTISDGLTGITPAGETLRVREVWADNLEVSLMPSMCKERLHGEKFVSLLQAEMELMRNVVDQYPFVAMDTEFPGVVAR